MPPTVTIGANDHWFVNGVDTGKKATGTDGKDGVSPTITIGNNGNWFVDGTDTGKKSRWCRREISGSGHWRER